MRAEKIKDSAAEANPFPFQGKTSTVGGTEKLLGEVGKRVDWLWKNSKPKDRASFIFGLGAFLLCTQVFNSFWSALGAGVLCACVAWITPFLSRY